MSETKGKSGGKSASQPKRAAEAKSTPTTKTKPMPAGMHSVTPHIICAGAAEAIEFYKKAFGATEMFRLPGPDGKLMHGSISIGDSAVMLAEENEKHGVFGPKRLNGSPVIIHLYVEDADAFVARAAEAGANVTMPVAEMFWGDRYGRLQDPFGHMWSVSTHVRDVTPDELKQAVQSMKG
jgi:PhnB protein